MSEVDRIRAFRHALDEAIAERVEELPWGKALHSPSLRNVYEVNFLRVEKAEPPPVGELVAAADEHQAELFHRKVVVDRRGDELAPSFRVLGWTDTAHVVMAHRREPDRRVDTSAVREVSLDDIISVENR